MDNCINHSFDGQCGPLPNVGDLKRTAAAFALSRFFIEFPAKITARYLFDRVKPTHVCAFEHKAPHNSKPVKFVEASTVAQEIHYVV